MAQFTTLFRVSSTEGYYWRVISEGKILASGAAATDFEARLAAEQATNRLERAEPPAAG